MAISAACVGEVSKAAIQPLNDVAAPIKTSLSSAAAAVADAIVRMAAGTTNFESTFIVTQPQWARPDATIRANPNF
jgi:hypothetical protein